MTDEKAEEGEDEVELVPLGELLEKIIREEEARRAESRKRFADLISDGQ